MQRKEYYYVRGNTAIAPSKKDDERKDDKQQIKRQKKANKQKALERQKKSDRKYMFVIATSIFILGITLISREGSIYKMQKQVSTMKNEISNFKENNEALKVKILKHSSLSNVEENAVSKLSMHIPQKQDVVKIDFSENYFESVHVDDEVESEKKNTIFSKIVSLFK